MRLLTILFGHRGKHPNYYIIFSCFYNWLPMDAWPRQSKKYFFRNPLVLAKMRILLLWYIQCAHTRYYTEHTKNVSYEKHHFFWLLCILCTFACWKVDSLFLSRTEIILDSRNQDRYRDVIMVRYSDVTSWSGTRENLDKDNYQRIMNTLRESLRWRTIPVR